MRQPKLAFFVISLAGALVLAVAPAMAADKKSSTSDHVSGHSSNTHASSGHADRSAAGGGGKSSVGGLNDLAKGSSDKGGGDKGGKGNPLDTAGQVFGIVKGFLPH